MKCHAKPPDHRILLLCDEEAGHYGDHRAATMEVGVFVTWPQKTYEFEEALADLAKLWRPNREEPL